MTPLPIHVLVGASLYAVALRVHAWARRCYRRRHGLELDDVPTSWGRL